MIFIISLVGIAASYQIAYLSEEGIAFHIAFWKVRFIRWGEVTDIAVENLPTYRSPMSDFYKKWIVFYTAESQRAKNGGENRRGGQFPGQIKYTPKNLSLLCDFCRQNGLEKILNFLESSAERTDGQR